jgi:hypothetical protein
MSAMQITKLFVFAAVLVCFFAHSCPVFGARIGANEVQVLPLFDTRFVLADGTSQPVSIDAVSARPLASHLNFEVGNTVANDVIAAIGANGEVCIYSTSEIDLVVDISTPFIFYNAHLHELAEL